MHDVLYNDIFIQVYVAHWVCAPCDMLMFPNLTHLGKGNLNGRIAFNRLSCGHVYMGAFFEC